MAQVRILFLAVAAALAAIVLVGCDKNPCEKLADGYYSYRSAALGCAYVIPSVKIGDACSVSSNSCDGNDSKLLDDYAACIGEIAKCETGKEQAFADAETACYKPLDSLSDTCAPALSMVCTTSTNQAYSLTDAYANLEGIACGSYWDDEVGMAKLTALEHFKTWEDCLREMANCTHKDIDALEAYTLCMVSMDACEDGAEADFEAAANACFTATTLSQGCMDALKVKTEAATQ